MTPYYDEGGITIYHGDATRFLADAYNDEFDLILTDPPYGIGVHYGIYDDCRSNNYWYWFGEVVKNMRKAAKVVAFTHRVDALKEVKGWDWAGCWSKPASFSPRMGNSPIVPHWEPILMFGIHTLGTSTAGRSDVYSVQPVPAKGLASRGRESWAAADHVGHPTPKPVELFRALIDSVGQNAETILDPFMGSGTTLRAAKDLGRRAVGIEIEEKYCEIAARRMGQEVLAL